MGPRLRRRWSRGDPAIIAALQLPLVFAWAPEPKEKVKPRKKKQEKVKPRKNRVLRLRENHPAVDLREERIEWSDDGALQMHSVLIERSLKALRGRCGVKTKVEILDWIFDDKTEPFSFLVCCALEGFDPEWIREEIETLLEKNKGTLLDRMRAQKQGEIHEVIYA